MLVDTPEAIAAGRRLALAVDGSAKSGLECGLLPLLCVCVRLCGAVW
jgi:hypothetical protein